MTTLYGNFLSGTITDNPLTINSLIIDSLDFATLPVVIAPDIMWLTLDPNGIVGNPEIVKIISHTTGATVITVQRAQQLTVARQHSAGTNWIISFTKSDIADIYTSISGNATLITANSNAIITNSTAITTNSGAITTLQTNTVPTAWVIPTYATGWAAYGGWSTPGYRKIGDIVYLRGLYQASAGVTALVFTLPVGFRPPIACLMSCYSSRAAPVIRLDVNISGAVQITAPVNGEWYALDCLQFSISA